MFYLWDSCLYNIFFLLGCVCGGGGKEKGEGERQGIYEKDVALPFQPPFLYTGNNFSWSPLQRKKEKSLFIQTLNEIV